jgi:hemoglobin
MKTSHAGLGITEREWELFLDHTRATLEHLEVAAREQDEVLDFFNGLKADVIQPQVAHTGLASLGA